VAVSATVFEILTLKAIKSLNFPIPPFSETPFGGNPLEFGNEIWRQKTRIMGLPDGEEIMCFRTNILIRKFSHCSFTVKCSLFRSYCLSLYDIGLWRKFAVSCMNKLRSCYNKCIKSFFGYHRSFSVTQVLLQTGLLSFDTVLHNGAYVFIRM